MWIGVIKLFVYSGNLSSSLPGANGNVIAASKWNELHNTLANINIPEEQASLDLGDALDADAVNAILGDSDIRSALFPFVSESSERSAEEIAQLVQSQQFQQRLQTLNAALQQDALSSIVDALETEKGTHTRTMDRKCFNKSLSRYQVFLKGC